MTNFEKIKAMDIEKTANMINYMINDCDFCPALDICSIYTDDKKYVSISCCKKEIKKWLESEVKENEDN